MKSENRYLFHATVLTEFPAAFPVRAGLTERGHADLPLEKRADIVNACIKDKMEGKPVPAAAEVKAKPKSKPAPASKPAPKPAPDSAGKPKT